MTKDIFSGEMSFVTECKDCGTKFQKTEHFIDLGLHFGM
jgi:hypothetical protein